MSRLISILAILALALTAYGEQKVVERSSKKAPAWVMGVTDGYIRVTVEAKNIPEAEKMAMSEVATRIISSVATNISTDQRTSMSNIDTGDKVESREEYSYESRIRAANLPFLKGISQAKVKDVYWEKLRDKHTGKETYVYSILYPFDQGMLARLILEYESYDGEKVSQLDALENDIHAIKSTDQIKAAITELNTLEKYFIDNVRLQRTKGLIKRYKGLYDNIIINVVKSGDSKCRVTATLDGRPLRINSAPKVTSNCACQINVSQQGDAFVIDYSTIDCLDDEENSLDITFRLDGHKVSKHYVF